LAVVNHVPTKHNASPWKRGDDVSHHNGRWYRPSAQP